MIHMAFDSFIIQVYLMEIEIYKVQYYQMFTAQNMWKLILSLYSLLQQVDANIGYFYCTQSLFYAFYC